MALLFFEDFETDGAAFWGGGTGSAEMGVVYAGLISWKLDANTDYHVIGDTHEIWLDFYWYSDTTSINFHHIASFMATAFLIAGLRVGADGKLAIYRETTLLATGTTVLLPLTWYHIAIHILRDATSGVFDVSINGTPEISFSGNSGANDFNRLRFGSGNASADYYDNISGYDSEPVSAIPPVIVDCDFSAVGTGSIGIRVADTAQIYQSRADGAGYDLQVDTASEAQVDDLTLANITQNAVGLINPLRSDRAVWDTGGYAVRHASDINDSTFLYHLSGAATQTYTVSNPSTDRAYDVSATTLNEIAAVLGTLIADLQAKGLLG